jgi:hypothetical protein
VKISVSDISLKTFTSYCGIFAQSKNYGVTIAGRYWRPARKQQEMGGLFCAVRIDGCARNSEIRHTIAKKNITLQQSNGVFYAVRVNL